MDTSESCLGRFCVMLFSICVVFGFAQSAAAATLQNIPPTPHGAPTRASLPQIAAAIEAAASDLGWTAREEEEGLIRASLFLRSHEAIVAIGYDATNFWINYVDSVNLKYHAEGLKKTKSRKAVPGPRIHKNYNGWISRLASRIADRAKNPPRVVKIPARQIRQELLIADELEKLEGLRRKGVLSPYEFETQKEKLLAR